MTPLPGDTVLVRRVTAVVCDPGGAATNALSDEFNRANESFPANGWCPDAGTWILSGNAITETTGASNRTARNTTPLSCTSAQWACVHINATPTGSTCVGVTLRAVDATGGRYIGMACAGGTFFIASMTSPTGTVNSVQGGSSTLDGNDWLCFQVFGTGASTDYSLRLNRCDSLATCTDRATWSATGAHMSVDGATIPPVTGTDTGTFVGVHHGQVASGAFIDAWVAGCTN